MEAHKRDEHYITQVRLVELSGSKDSDNMEVQDRGASDKIVSSRELQMRLHEKHPHSPPRLRDAKIVRTNEVSRESKMIREDGLEWSRIVHSRAFCWI